jgi:diguanylate cyclase (GGDEF)-like protein
MADGHQKMLADGASLSSIVPRQRVYARSATEQQHELALLRATNSQLRRELAVLKEREAQAQRLADRDGLTGLYNRRRMLELLDATIAEAAQFGQSVGLLFIDLNGFKEINDEYGHAAGDSILTTAALRIAARVRAGDFACRYGGDEFVVILPNVPNAAAVSRVADTIRERMALSHWIEGQEQHLTAAVGESMYPRDGDTAAQLLKRADQDMYRLKARLSRPMVSLGSVPQQRPARRRNDKAKPAHGHHAE